MIVRISLQITILIGYSHDMHVNNMLVNRNNG